ncbi:hypothetical protein P691DRAFT_789934 [Macrolepiota fuliginosa MF-IS2]|uniref:DUF8190 domain-containing protein n=1 Tax=Macrolepiota fuliginosa MF-IS2 TaxID=1400762 RepID=A0A9P5X049_9AGAR|nr:hypothetical protein P691DRAFT_789934 [Macrolepiota fuliginosa MF-IS2]
MASAYEFALNAPSDYEGSDEDDFSNSFLEPLKAPFDIGLAPMTLGAGDDAPGQAIALAGALAAPNRGDDDEAQGFFVSHPKRIELTQLEQIYNSYRSSSAIQLLLGGRREVSYEGGAHTVDVEDPKLLWMMDKSFLDLLVCVGRGLGLGPILPNLEALHTFEFKLELNAPNRQFTAKNVQLGFDPRGSMLWIGRSPSGEDVWLAFVTYESQEQEEGDLINLGGKSTALNASQYRRTVMFLAKALEDIRYLDTVVYEDYPDVDDKRSYKDATNIFDRPHIHLNLEKLNELDKAIQRMYFPWVEKAPDAYKTDQFFLQRIPICVTSRYGQNQQIGVNLGQEVENWHRDRDFSRIRYITVAIATHMCVRRVACWKAISPSNIIQNYRGNVFDKEDPFERRHLTQNDLENLDFEDENGYQIPIFNDQGYHIQRRQAGFKKDEYPLGILIKSARLQDLFTRDNDDMGTLDKVADFDFYPQAGLRRVGHFQASGLMAQCYPLVSEIDRSLRPQDDDMDGMHGDKGVVFGISSQGYNAVMHNTRGRMAQHHDAQVGLVTGALAGAWVPPNSSSGGKAARLLQKCTHKMPHDAYSNKIKDPAITRDFRLENVYYIDMDGLPEGDRDGSVVIQDILLPLANIWNHGTLYETLKKHVQLFKPHAFPALYKWTTYPLTVLLENIFKQAQAVYRKDGIQRS